MTVSRRLWPALLALVAVVMLAVVGGSWNADPLVPVDEPLPDLPAVTLAGERLDRAYFGDRPWVVLVWLPG